MSEQPRFVFDTNTLVSAALFQDSVPDQALRRGLATGDILISSATIAELSEVLSRPKFDRYLTREERDLFLGKLVQRAVLLEVQLEVRICRDPSDDMYLALAIAGRADLIVSGDADLRALDSVEGIRILTPAEFVLLPNQR
jgi:putative PIN family toxin of toxin-antitoxin system